MTINKIASAVAKKEGKKSQARIGDIKEILTILSDMSYLDDDVIIALLKNGSKRADKKAKK